MGFLTFGTNFFIKLNSSIYHQSKGFGETDILGNINNSDSILLQLKQFDLQKNNMVKNTSILWACFDEMKSFIIGMENSFAGSSPLGGAVLHQPPQRLPASTRATVRPGDVSNEN